MNVHAHKHPHTPTKLCGVKANRSFCFFACGMDFNAIIDAFKAAITTCDHVSSVKNCVTSGFIIMDDKLIGGILINFTSLNLPTITECIYERFRALRLESCVRNLFIFKEIRRRVGDCLSYSCQGIPLIRTCEVGQVKWHSNVTARNEIKNYSVEATTIKSSMIQKSLIVDSNLLFENEVWTIPTSVSLDT